MALPAKLRMPVLAGPQLLERPRLFARLEGDKSAPAIWISGPPGAGKTVLVQTWLQQRGSLWLWYRVDGADADPALLPYGLRQAALSVLPEHLAASTNLPLWTPERGASLEAFASDFFSPLFEALSAATVSRVPGANANPVGQPGGVPVLVFDNLDEAVASDGFSRLLAAALECAEASEVRLVLIARTGPVGPFVRLLSHECLDTLDGHALRTTDQEAADLLSQRVGPSASTWPSADAAWLNSWCDGWISGLVLASDAGPSRGAGPRDSRLISGQAQERIHAYLAAAVLHARPDRQQHALLACALMPTFTTTMGVALTGYADLGPVLAELAGANRFVTLRYRVGHGLQEPPVYEFHALLRDHLLSTGHAAWPPELRQRLLLHAARLLLEDDQLDAASEALIEAMAWDELAKVVRARANELLNTGRHKTLERLLAMLPARVQNEDPWLQYWHGQCLTLSDPLQACLALAAAHEGFVHCADLPGRILSWCAIVEAITMEWRDFSVLDNWIAEGDQLLRDHPFETLPAEMAPRLSSAMFSALIWRQQSRSDVPIWLRRTLDGILVLPPGAERLMVGMPVFLYQAAHQGDHRELDKIHALLRSGAGSCSVAPLAEVMGCVVDATHAWIRGHRTQALESVARGRRIRATYDIALPGWLLTSQHVYALATDGELTLAAAELAQARASELDPARLLDIDNADYLAALIALQGGRLEEALHLIRKTHEVVTVIGGPMHWTLDALAEAQIQHELGRTDDAKRLLEQAVQDPQCACGELFVFQVQACWALFDLDTGNDPTPALRCAFDIGARNDVLNFLWFRPTMFAKLCAAALERNIERDYALRLISRRQLQPPSATEAWPWPVKLYCRHGNTVQLWVQGKLIGQTRGKPDAPLRLLLAIVALAFGSPRQARAPQTLPLRPIDRAALVRHLRPSGDDDAIDDWIDQNLKRLRRRLNTPDAVLSWARKLALNPSRIWVDLLDG